MTSEQREILECLKDRKEIDLIEVIRTFKREGTENFAIVRKKYLDTALSLIKEQQEEIGSLQKELNEENKRSMILANNDKFKEQVIDLMALAIINYDDQLVISQYKNINEVKQYFAGLVEKE